MNRTPGINALGDADWDLDPLVAIRQMREARDYLDFKIEEAVREARTVTRAKGIIFDHVDGETRQNTRMGLATWNDIAASLGVTRQAAHRRFGHLID